MKPRNIKPSSMNQSQTFSRKLPALLLLAGAIVLMQKHAWEFWKEFDADFYWLWAVMLEGAALWLWSQRNAWKNAIAFLATLMVLAGPLYQVSKPAIEMLHKAETESGLLAERKAELKADKTQLTADLATYNENSLHRAGWAGLITATKADLKAVNTELNALSKAQGKPVPMQWQALAVIAMQAIAMVIFQMVIVFSIRSLTPNKATISNNDREFHSVVKAAQILKDIFDHPFGKNEAKTSANAQSLKAAA